jgi:hypothetical protein
VRLIGWSASPGTGRQHCKACSTDF